MKKEQIEYITNTAKKILKNYLFHIEGRYKTPETMYLQEVIEMLANVPQQEREKCNNV